MGLKKRLCNPVAEAVARNGDPEVEGLFTGAGRAAGVITDDKVKNWFEQEVIECEGEYVEGRKKLASDTASMLHEINHKLLEKVGYTGYKGPA